MNPNSNNGFSKQIGAIPASTYSPTSDDESTPPPSYLPTPNTISKAPGGISLRPQPTEPPTSDTTLQRRSACVCDDNFKCVKDGLFYDSFDICIPYDSENTRIERANVTSLNATHVPTQTLFQAIIGKAISPWVTISIGGNEKLVIVHFDHVLPPWLRRYKNNILLVEGKISVVTTEHVEISNIFELEAKIAINSDAPNKSDVVGCLCDASKMCRDDTTTYNVDPVLRICLSLSKSSMGRISSISSLILRKDGPRGFPFEVITHFGISPLATVEISGENAIVTIQLMSVFFDDTEPIKISGLVETTSSAELITRNLEMIESFVIMANIGIASIAPTTSISEAPTIEPGPDPGLIGCICHPNFFDENDIGCGVGVAVSADEPNVQVCLKTRPKGVELVCTRFCLTIALHELTFFLLGENHVPCHGPSLFKWGGCPRRPSFTKWRWHHILQGRSPGGGDKYLHRQEVLRWIDTWRVGCCEPSRVRQNTQ